MSLLRCLRIVILSLLFISCNQRIDVKSDKNEFYLHKNNETLYQNWLAPDIFYLSYSDKGSSSKQNREFDVPTNRDFLPFKVNVIEEKKYLILKSDSLELRVKKGNLNIDIFFENQEFASDYVDRREVANLKFDKKKGSFLFGDNFINFDSLILDNQIFKNVSSYVPNLYLSSNNFGIYKENFPNIEDRNPLNINNLLFIYGENNIDILKRYLAINSVDTNIISTTYIDEFFDNDESLKVLEPFLNSLLIQNNDNKLYPLFPISIYYPKDSLALKLNNHFLIGDRVLITDNVDSCYLPKGTWYNYKTKKLYNSKDGMYVSTHGSFDFFVKSGSVIPVKSREFNLDENVLFLEAFPGFLYSNKFYEKDPLTSSNISITNVLFSSTEEIMQLVLEKSEGDYIQDDRSVIIKIVASKKPKQLISSYGRSVTPLKNYTSKEEFINSSSGWLFDKKEKIIYIKSPLLVEEDTRFMAIF